MGAREEQVDLAEEFEKDLPDIITLQDDIQVQELGMLLSVPNMNRTLLVYQQDLDNTPPATPAAVQTSGQRGHQFYVPSLVTSSPLVTNEDTNVIVTPAHQVNSSATANTSSENISPEKSGKSCHQKSKHRKRRVVVSPRNKHRKLTGANDTARKSKKPPRSSSSSYAPTSSPASSDTYTPPRSKKRAPVARQSNSQESRIGSVGGTSITISRFQCRVCGQTRFLALVNYVGLPTRLCECGSTAVSVASWVRVARGPHGGLAGGGLGRECARCPRCCRLYCNEASLRRHHCSRQRRPSKTLTAMENGGKDDAVPEWPGVCEVPTCSLCGDAFIFDALLQRHIKRQHLT